jgi:cytochrome P450
MVAVALPGEARIAPGPSLFGLISRIRSVHENPLGLLVADHALYGDVVRYNRFDRVMQSFAHPDHVRHVLETHHTNYRRSAIYAKMRPVLGDGLVTADGPHWQRQRRLIQPAFAKAQVAALADVMLDETDRLIARWQERPPPSVDVAVEMMRLTLSIAGRTLFHSDVSGFADAIGSALKTALDEVDRRIDELWNWPEWLPVARNRALWRAVQTLDDVVYRIIEERRRAPGGSNDVLSLMMAARDPETGAGMSDKQLRDEVLTLLLAGHETTANWLTWTWYLVGGHPDVERRMHDELARVLGARRPTLADLPKLSYLRQVTDEALRLYPPVWGIDRGAVEEDVLGGYKIPAGSVVVLSQYITHRHPEFWHEPGRFDPDRFALESSSGRPKHAFYPFGGGPRQCIGTSFAAQEALLVLATLAQRVRFARQNEHPVELDAGVTLRPRHGMKMNLSLRD